MRSDVPLAMIDNRVRGSQLVGSISRLMKIYRNNECITLPSEASISFTGQSRTEATKQYAGALLDDAPGYQAKLTTAEDCGNVRL